MYAHLLVPLDDSILSTVNTREAVRLAAAWRARITFFHATEDYAATGDGALLRSVAPATFADAAAGDTHGLLQKARASAAAGGVQCDMKSCISDRPAEAIVKAAADGACDLIVMASHGGRGLAGWLRRSHTEQVLRHAGVPVLVTRVESSEPLSPRERALSVILDEHRSIACVIRGMRDLAAEATGGRTALDRRNLEAMLAYVREFPLRQHHPKEERHLHPKLRLRHPACESLLQEIEEQHVQEHRLVEHAGKLLLVTGGSDSEMAVLIDHLARAVWTHLRLEEDRVLPLASQYLLDEDWTEIADAFEANNDPGFGNLSADDFKRMFVRIANLLASVRR